MEITTASSGNYPRVGHKSGQLRLREAYREWEVGELSDEELERAYKDYTKEVIREQEKAGLDIVTDGQLRWYGPISHFGRQIEGCEINGLLRYFDTNFYVRQPVVKSYIAWKSPIVKEEFASSKDISNVSLKPVVTGPYTLAKYSIDEFYGNLEELTLEFSKIIGREVGELSDLGAKEIQVDEPAILDDEENFELFCESMKIVSENCGDSQLDLYLYFGDSSPLYEKLQELPVELLGLDFTYSPKLPETIEEFGSDKMLGLGLIDARNTKMENPDDILPIIERIASSVEGDQLYLNPSCGLEYLPRDKAFEKLNNMVNIAKKFEGVR